MADESQVDAAAAAPPGRRIGAIALHPVLLAIHPALVLWAANVDEVTADEVWPAIWVPLLVAIGVWVVATALLRSVRSGAVTASVMITIALYAGRVGDGLTLAPLLAIAALGAAGIAPLLRRLRRDTIIGVTAVLNVLAVTLVALVAPGIVGTLWARAGSNPPGGIDVTMAAGTAARDDLPDIFYLIPDRYPREDSLRDFFDWDNSAWIAALEARGFQVADDALANYPSTGMSLASTWNLAPIDQLVDTPSNPKDWAPAYSLLKDHALGRNLTRAGYEYIHMGTWWSPTSVAASADQNLRLEGTSEFVQVFRDQVAPGAARSAPGTDALKSLKWYERSPLHTLFQWQELGRLAAEEYEQRDRPRFVLAHITVPHEPYVFEPDGSSVAPEVAKSRTREDNFVRQVQYVNNQIDDFLDVLLSGPREQWPMVVIQSDEGPHPVAKTSSNYDWLVAPHQERQEKLQILSAILLPAGSDLVLPEDLRSVNTWRLLLDELLGSDLGPINAPIYVYSPAAIYDVVDVTDEMTR